MLPGTRPLIIAGAATKDLGLYLLRDWKLDESWVPAATGGLFLLPYLVSIWVLHRLPAPDASDEAARTVRANLDAAGRRAFLARVGGGFALLVLAYFLLTAYRDFRDHYGREILKGLGHEGYSGIFVRTAAAIASCSSRAPKIMLTRGKSPVPGATCSRRVSRRKPRKTSTATPQQRRKEITDRMNGNIAILWATTRWTERSPGVHCQSQGPIKQRVILP